MKISYNWLQSYFDEKLPEPEKLGELLTFASFEMEGLEKKGDNSILDVKVLPDRACYALSHRGMVYEISAITGLPKKKIDRKQPEIKKVRALSVKVEDKELCPRYMARVVENVTQRDLAWVKTRLEAIGQRCINPVVDIANMVMLDRGQPLHAFDADKVKGGITVRRARSGEKITTLDNREVNLDETILIIADDEAPLAIAGIKGGKRAEVTSTTKNLIIESASFDASYIRKTSDRIGIRTDASKRYENKFSRALAEKGMSDFSGILFEMDNEICAGGVLDCYPDKLEVWKLQVSKEEIATKIGIDIPEKQIEEIFQRLMIGFEKTKEGWTLTPPVFRADLLIAEDIAEEIGRLVGYDKVPAILPPKTDNVLEIPKSFYYEWKIREALVNAGFSEVMTSSFSSKGEVEILKPLADDKRFARPQLRDGFANALKLNATNSALFGSDEVKIFEIGKVFDNSGEHTSLAIGYSGPKKKVAGVLDGAQKTVSEVLSVTVAGEIKEGIVECNLDSMLAGLLKPSKWDVTIPQAQNGTFKQFSVYPFIVRDIALFVPSGTEAETVHKVILENAGDSNARSWLFDRFEKDGKISYAFRLVFQSMERTLTDIEINQIMEKVTLALKGKSWEVR